MASLFSLVVALLLTSCDSHFTNNKKGGVLKDNLFKYVTRSPRNAIHRSDGKTFIATNFFYLLPSATMHVPCTPGIRTYSIRRPTVLELIGCAYIAWVCVSVWCLCFLDLQDM